MNTNNQQGIILATTPNCCPAGTRKGWQSVAAGVIAGCVTRTTTSPLDVLKILFQVKSQGATTLQSTCRTLFQTRGLTGFWKGNLAGCCRLGPYAGVKFCLFDQLQSLAHGDNDAPTNVGRVTCGALAGIAATFIVYPMELLRTRLIVSPVPLTIRLEARRIVQADGLRGFYRGCTSGLVGVIPFEGIQFACYEYGKAYATTHRWPPCRWPQNKTQLQTVDHLALGSIAGAVAQVVAYPLDTIKKRLQLQGSGSNARYDGMVDCLAKVVREEGAMALYRGTVPNMVRLVPYAAVMFASYEAAKDFLKAL
ncbi:hypothetical protein DYB37_010703 [Aphanomyces astaci]|uniref:Mitochondrial thiamine pyrophosphate carrier 1 n=1 Tax=Aphanomyces astaci TaxID=112090 RepID=A0A3R6XH19_APHAT|nr:hypothetical protein DYB35_010415 [Aphanomyces astaci]RHZ11606.1 hypothetical protein DYB37_010703 [Aphanomyces astaci]